MARYSFVSTVPYSNLIHIYSGFVRKFGFFALHMALSFTSINSGSNGNCYYFQSGDDAVLIDAGISCRETERRMSRLGLSLSNVRALFISHEHSDHIRGVEVLSRKYRLPVYITKPTLRSSRMQLDEALVKDFEAHVPYTIGNLTIYPFPKFHDASDPYSFIIEAGNVRAGVFTDIGAVCNNLIRYFKLCHAVFLEANYDEEMLDNGPYPYHLKKRIKGGRGHLSNRQALQLFTAHKPHFLQHVLLSHLSKENNCPVLVKDLFTAHSGNTMVTVASRDAEMPLLNISSDEPSVNTIAGLRRAFYQSQLSLF